MDVVFELCYPVQNRFGRSRSPCIASILSHERRDQHPGLDLVRQCLDLLGPSLLMGSMRSKQPKVVKLAGPVSPAPSMAVSGDQDSVSATEASRELNISPRSLRRLAEAGKIPSTSLSSSRMKASRRLRASAVCAR